MRKQLASLGSVISLILLAGLAKAGVSQSPAETALSARSIGISGQCLGLNGSPEICRKLQNRQGRCPNAGTVGRKSRDNVTQVCFYWAKSPQGLLADYLFSGES